MTLTRRQWLSAISTTCAFLAVCLLADCYFFPSLPLFITGTALMLASVVLAFLLLPGRHRKRIGKRALLRRVLADMDQAKSGGSR